MTLNILLKRSLTSLRLVLIWALINPIVPPREARADILPPGSITYFEAGTPGVQPNRAYVAAGIQVASVEFYATPLNANVPSLHRLKGTVEYSGGIYTLLPDPTQKYDTTVIMWARVTDVNGHVGQSLTHRVQGSPGPLPVVARRLSVRTPEPVPGIADFYEFTADLSEPIPQMRRVIFSVRTYTSNSSTLYGGVEVDATADQQTVTATFDASSLSPGTYSVFATVYDNNRRIVGTTEDISGGYVHEDSLPTPFNYRFGNPEPVLVHGEPQPPGRLEATTDPALDVVKVEFYMYRFNARLPDWNSLGTAYRTNEISGGRPIWRLDRTDWVPSHSNPRFIFARATLGDGTPTVPATRYQSPSRSINILSNSYSEEPERRLKVTGVRFVTPTRVRVDVAELEMIPELQLGGVRIGIYGSNQTYGPPMFGGGLCTRTGPNTWESEEIDVVAALTAGGAVVMAQGSSRRRASPTDWNEEDSHTVPLGGTLPDTAAPVISFPELTGSEPYSIETPAILVQVDDVNQPQESGLRRFTATLDGAQSVGEFNFDPAILPAASERITFSNLSFGEHTLTIQAWDAAGNNDSKIIRFDYVPSGEPILLEGESGGSIPGPLRATVRADLNVDRVEFFSYRQGEPVPDIGSLGVARATGDRDGYGRPIYQLDETNPMPSAVPNRYIFARAILRDGTPVNLPTVHETARRPASVLENALTEEPERRIQIQQIVFITATRVVVRVKENEIVPEVRLNEGLMRVHVVKFEPRIGLTLLAETDALLQADRSWLTAEMDLTGKDTEGAFAYVSATNSGFQEVLHREWEFSHAFPVVPPVPPEKPILIHAGTLGSFLEATVDPSLSVAEVEFFTFPDLGLPYMASLGRAEPTGTTVGGRPLWRLASTDTFPSNKNPRSLVARATLNDGLPTVLPTRYQSPTVRGVEVPPNTLIEEPARRIEIVRIWVTRPGKAKFTIEESEFIPQLHEPGGRMWIGPYKRDSNGTVTGWPGAACTLQPDGTWMSDEVDISPMLDPEVVVIAGASGKDRSGGPGYWIWEDTLPKTKAQLTDPTAPVIEFPELTGPEPYSVEGGVIRVQVNDPELPIESGLVTVRSFIDNTLKDTFNFFPPSLRTEQRDINVSGLSIGEHQLRIEAVDAAGNLATRSIRFAIGSGLPPVLMQGGTLGSFLEATLDPNLSVAEVEFFTYPDLGIPYLASLGRGVATGAVVNGRPVWRLASTPIFPSDKNPRSVVARASLDNGTPTLAPTRYQSPAIRVTVPPNSVTQEPARRIDIVQMRKTIPGRAVFIINEPQIIAQLRESGGEMFLGLSKRMPDGSVVSYPGASCTLQSDGTWKSGEVDISPMIDPRVMAIAGTSSLDRSGRFRWVWEDTLPKTKGQLADITPPLIEFPDLSGLEPYTIEESSIRVRVNDPELPIESGLVVIQSFIDNNSIDAFNYSPPRLNTVQWDVSLNGVTTGVEHRLRIDALDAESNVATRTIRFTIPGGGLPPVITAHPQPITVNVGQTASFSVQATGTAPLQYQWQRNQINITGATSASYTTLATTLTDDGSKFRCIVTNTFGSATSNEALLTVVDSQAPVITVHPVDQTVDEGQTATFQVTATGSAPLQYQWQKNQVNIGGATSASYTTPATTLSDDGSLFRCIVSNAFGSATSNNAKLTVRPVAGGAIEITSPLNNDIYGTQNILRIIGSVSVAPYQIDYGVGPNPTTWLTTGITMTNNGQQPVMNGELGQWNPATLSEGFYTLRVRNAATSGMVKMIYFQSKMKKNFPVYLDRPNFEGYNGGQVNQVQIADLRGNGAQQIIVLRSDPINANNQKLIVLNMDGSVAWTKTLGGTIDQLGWGHTDIPLIGAVGNAGTEKTIFLTLGDPSVSDKSKLYAFRADGNPLNANYPVSLPWRGLSHGKSLADFNRNGKPYLILSPDFEQHMYVVDPLTGQTVGTPFNRNLGGQARGHLLNPAVGPLGSVNETKLSIVTESGSEIVAYQLGSVEPVWRFSTLQSIPNLYPHHNSTPIIADVDGDGNTDVVVVAQNLTGVAGSGTFTARLIVLDHLGRLKPGFPVTVGEILGSLPLLIPNPESAGKYLIAVDTIETGTNVNSISIYKHNGSLYHKRPFANLVGKTIAMVAGDITGDGKISIVMAAGGFSAGIVGAGNVVGSNGVYSLSVSNPSEGVKRISHSEGTLFESGSLQNSLIGSPVLANDNGNVVVAWSTEHDIAFGVTAGGEFTGTSKNRSSIFVYEFKKPYVAANMIYPTPWHDTEHTSSYLKTNGGGTLPPPLPINNPKTGNPIVMSNNQLQISLSGTQIGALNPNEPLDSSIMVTPTNIEKITLPIEAGRKLTTVFSVLGVSEGNAMKGLIDSSVPLRAARSFSAKAFEGSGHVFVYLNGNKWEEVPVEGNEVIMWQEGFYALMSIDETDEGLNLHKAFVYPNPSNSPTFYVEAGIPDSLVIEIFDSAGASVHKVQMERPTLISNGRYAYEYKWNASAAAGIYSYVVEAKKAGYQAIRIVKQLAILK